MSDSRPETAEPALRRSLSLPLLTLYGLGTTIGAGIYALTGAVAGRAGMAAPLAFALASLLASFSAFSFAELGSRYPKSAGEAAYVRAALPLPGLPLVVGLLVALSGIVSAATIANAFVGHLSELQSVLTRAPSIVLLVLVLCGLAAWGIQESVLAAAVVTVVEVCGLALVFWAASGSLVELPTRLPELIPAGSTAWAGVLGGSILAFYAFLGFEDMVNVAEEVVDVRRTLPVAILLTLVITTLLYFGLSLVAVLAVPPAELATSGAPLALVYERSGGHPAVLSSIGILALVNGALIQVIMASRVLYGLAQQGSLPVWLGRIHSGRRTPLVATGLVGLAVVVLALGFSLEPLAEATSMLALVVFALVNLALLVIKRREPPPKGVAVFPAWVPALGLVVSVGFLAFGLIGR